VSAWLHFLKSQYSKITGYKLREKISKALKTRSEAIKSALRQYNEAGACLSPPRPQLTWSSVLNAATIADFDLLRDTRTDIRSLPWAEPSRREAMGYYFGMKRAREEIVRLNVEINRLLTFMVDSHADYYHAIQANIVQNPSLAYALSLEWQYQDQLHESIMRKLIETSKLPGFTGTLSFGERLNRDKALNKDVPLPSWMKVKSVADTVNVGQAMEVDSRGNGDDDDDVPRELDVGTDALVEFIDRIGTSDN